jgi:hypothetical protein
MMSEETKRVLSATSRGDLLRIWKLNQSGYAGINRDGRIVDRREHPDAIPIQANESLGIPAPKSVYY